MWIAYNMQSTRPLSSSEFSAMLDQGTSNPTTLHAGINKQGVQFTLAIFSGLHRCKSYDRASPFRNEHSAVGDLFRR